MLNITCLRVKDHSVLSLDVESCPSKLRLVDRGVPEEERICQYCDLNQIESEIHFVLFCPFYHDLRFVMFDQIDTTSNLVALGDGDLLKCLFDNVFALAEFLSKAWDRRRKNTFA